MGGDEVRLEAKVMLVLVHLAEHAGRVVSRAELEEQIWAGRVVTEDSVTKAVAKLRRVFRDDPRRPRVIETLPKSGYKLIAEVERVEKAREDVAFTATPTGTAGRPRGRPKARWLLGGLAALVLPVAAWWMVERERTPSTPPAPLVEKPAVAVVAFDNLGLTPDEDYFANGITADLITDLSKVKGLSVIAPGTAFAYRSGEAQPRKISAELHVD
jgi:hypothetical protein